MTYIDNLMGSLRLGDSEFCELLGCDLSRLERWRARGSILPGHEADLLADATGVPFETILEAGGRITPSPIWQKARESASDEDSVIAAARARVMGARFAALQTMMGASSVGFLGLVRGMREAASLVDGPVAQAARASEYFLRETRLDVGALPIGEVLRGFLRSHGFVVMEIPIRKTRLEGFLTYLSADRVERPLIVANSYRTTWFRRNYVILHEVGHLLDIETSASVFDRDTSRRDATEERADLFALHTLVPRRLLENLISRGLQVAGADEQRMARLIAGTHAEARHIARAAESYGLIDPIEARRLESLKVPKHLLGKESTHAATLFDAIGTPGYVRDSEALSILPREQRRTERPYKGLTVPVPYVLATKRALVEGRITRGRAAELLMVSEKTLADRLRLEH